jgi:hypothetical protein
MLFRFLKNSVLIRINKVFFLFMSSIFVSILTGYFFLIQKSLSDMRALTKQIAIQLDLLEKKQNVVALVAQSPHVSKSYWNFLSENVDPVLVAVVIGAFVAGCYLGSQGFFSYGIVTQTDSIPSFPSPSLLKKVITSFDVDYTNVGFRVHTIVDPDKGVAHFISKITESSSESSKLPLDFFLTCQAELISTSTESTFVSSEVAAEAARNALIFSSYL